MAEGEGLEPSGLLQAVDFQSTPLPVTGLTLQNFNDFAVNLFRPTINSSMIIAN